MHLFTQSALLRALGWSLFNSIWQMGFLWLFYRTFVAAFGRSSARIRHNLALGLVSIGTIATAAECLTGYRFASTGAENAAWVGGWLFEGQQHGHLWHTARLYIDVALPWCSTLYLLVLGVLLARYCRHYFYSKKLTHAGLSKMAPALRVFIQSTSRRMGIRQPLRVWLSSLVDVPLTLGFFRPVILLPVAMVNNLTVQQTEAILLHELAHIRCNDYLINLGVAVLELAFFFNPFSRLLIREVKREREHRCDDWVMQFRYDPHSYVSALLSLACGSARLPLLTMAATGNGTDRLLLERARRILQQKNRHSRKISHAILLPLAVLLLALGLGLLQKPISTTDDAGSVAAGSHLYAFVPGLIKITAIPIRFTPLPAAMSTELTGIAIPANQKRAPVAQDPARKPRPAITPNGAENDLTVAGLTDEADGDNALVLAAGGSNTDAGASSFAPENYAVTTIPQGDNREYSITSSPSITFVPAPETQKKMKTTGNQPFVPHSSFSFRYMEDSIRPEEQLAYLQLYNQQEITTAIEKLQNDLKASGASSPGPGQRDIRRRQEQIQQQFRLKFDALEKKLEKANRRLRIVYI
jgi:beta-lactamase regulating signal transducer with metallopeptidase domain